MSDIIERFMEKAIDRKTPKLEGWFIDNSMVILKKETFEHLLDCLYYQREMPDIPEGALLCNWKKRFVPSNKKELQKYIDGFYEQGINLIDQSKKEEKPFIQTLSDLNLAVRDTDNINHGQ